MKKKKPIKFGNFKIPKGVRVTFPTMIPDAGETEPRKRELGEEFEFGFKPRPR